MLKFHASQNLTMTVLNQAISIEHYLRQPQRLVQAVTARTQLEQLGPSEFRLKLRPLKFMTFSIEPIVDLQVVAGADGTIYLRSQTCKIRGAEYLQKSFIFNLAGKLSHQNIGAATMLKGTADLTVQLELPPALQLTPKPILETAGNALLNGILITMKNRLERQLLQDYHLWVQTTTAMGAEASNVVPMGSPVS
jgi:hypothetical protein